MTAALFVAACVLYGASGLGFLVTLATGRESAGRTLVGLLAAGAVLHLAGLGVRFAQLGLPPVTTGFEGLSLLSLLIAGIYLALLKKHAVRAMGAFVAPLVFLHLTASLLFSDPARVVPQALRSGYFVLHISLAFLGDAFLATAAVASVAYVLQERQVRLKTLSHAGRLPNLNVTDHLAWRFVTLGFLFMSLGIASGMLYAKHAWHAYWSWDPRQTWSVVTWLLYALMLHARLTSGWRGRRFAWLTMGAFALVVSAAVVLDVLKLGRHSGDYDARPTAVMETG
jgi:cytochrome c-type biogenesis protein CcsB